MASSKVDRVRAGRPRLACPVCLGAQMVKIKPAPDRPLELDYCRRCGGIWFDPGEVGALRGLTPQALWTHVHLEPEAFRMKCHRCHASVRRNEAACPACGQENALQCPVDGAQLARIEKSGLVLDACPACHGVWFDNVELAEVWNRTIGALAKRRPGRAAPGTMDADHFLLGAMLFDPFSAMAVGHLAVSAAAPVLSVAGQAAGAAVEATGELAGGLFSAIADIIGSIFDGL